MELMRVSELKQEPLPGWQLWMIFEVEPQLKYLGEKALGRFKRDPDRRGKAYRWAKPYFLPLVGWSARDPRLRSQEAYDCYTDWILYGDN